MFKRILFYLTFGSLLVLSSLLGRVLAPKYCIQSTAVKNIVTYDLAPGPIEEASIGQCSWLTLIDGEKSLPVHNKMRSFARRVEALNILFKKSVPSHAIISKNQTSSFFPQNIFISLKEPFLYKFKPGRFFIGASIAQASGGIEKALIESYLRIHPEDPSDLYIKEIYTEVLLNYVLGSSTEQDPISGQNYEPSKQTFLESLGTTSEYCNRPFRSIQHLSYCTQKNAQTSATQFSSSEGPLSYVPLSQWMLKPLIVKLVREYFNKVPTDLSQTFRHQFLLSSKQLPGSHSQAPENAPLFSGKSKSLSLLPSHSPVLSKIDPFSGTKSLMNFTLFDQSSSQLWLNLFIPMFLGEILPPGTPIQADVLENILAKNFINSTPQFKMKVSLLDFNFEDRYNSLFSAAGSRTTEYTHATEAHLFIVENPNGELYLPNNKILPPQVRAEYTSQESIFLSCQWPRLSDLLPRQDQGSLVIIKSCEQRLNLHELAQQGAVAYLNQHKNLEYMELNLDALKLATDVYGSPLQAFPINDLRKWSQVLLWQEKNIKPSDYAIYPTAVIRGILSFRFN